MSKLKKTTYADGRTVWEVCFGESEVPVLRWTEEMARGEGEPVPRVRCSTTRPIDADISRINEHLRKYVELGRAANNARADERSAVGHGGSTRAVHVQRSHGVSEGGEVVPPIHGGTHTWCAQIGDNDSVMHRMTVDEMKDYINHLESKLYRLKKILLKD